MNILSFYTPRPKEHPQTADYPAMLGALQKSCDLLGLRHVVLTDANGRETLAQRPESAGLECFTRVLPDRLMQACMRVQALWLAEGETRGGDSLFVGADCLMLRDPRKVFPAGVDLAVTLRPGHARYPINTGAVWLPAGSRTRQAALWARIADTTGPKWGDDQRAVDRALAPMPDRHGIFERFGMHVAFLPMAIHNHTPREIGDPCRDACVLHFRGKGRKDLMLPWAARWLGNSKRGGRMNEPLSVVCWKWKPAAGYRSEFGATQVNVLRAMVARHLKLPHRFICVTDDPAGIAPGIEIVKLWDDFATLPSPHGGLNPSCYRRLRAFSAEAGKWFGPRFVSMDLDTVIVGDITPLVDRPEDFVIWGDTNPTTPYNGGFWLLRAGTRTKVWTGFDPKASPASARALGYFGSDQAWIGAALGPDEAKWSTADGVYSYRVHVQPALGMLPRNARIVFFHGRHDPWQPAVQRSSPWIRHHYREDVHV
jgi:hypothetical protein